MLTGRSAAGCVDTVARGNNIALCVVVPDMPRLSLDGARAPGEQLFGRRPAARWNGGGETISGQGPFCSPWLPERRCRAAGLRVLTEPHWSSSAGAAHVVGVQSDRRGINPGDVTVGFGGQSLAKRLQQVNFLHIQQVRVSAGLSLKLAWWEKILKWD